MVLMEYSEISDKNENNKTFISKLTASLKKLH